MGTASLFFHNLQLVQSQMRKQRHSLFAIRELLVNPDQDTLHSACEYTN